ncbi:phage late control D family protein [Providencia stuartii]|uniref:phage late control D family protein n=1 Tax=Providencia stuartii TaxID=588 RepID=UPI0023E348D0|nr:phage late control D family protein [Providencia stuartii]ELR5143305.1 phage late control D family protein [Providencia stuartii]WER20928.1 phage late control D family protein [Providencia stuartii]WER25048.1 phage late control D family protein [Providencia stuartii]WER29138.1 phage late control D family protein [Providencia stuartii]
MSDFFLTGVESVPQYVLAAGDVNINERLQGRLMSLTMTDNRGFEADQLDIEIDDADGKMMLPKRGEVLSLHLGWKNEPLIFKGKFTVDEIEYSGAPDKITIRGRSADFRSSLNVKREISYHDKSLGDIIKTIAKRNNVEPVIENKLANIQLAHIDQTNESDGSFLARLGQQEGAIAAIKNGQLLFMPQGSGKTASGRPIPPLLLTRSVGDGYRFSLADRGAYTGVVASWLNTRKPQKKEDVKVKRKRKTKQKDKTKVDEPQGDYLVGEEGNTLTLSHTYANKGNAERAAKAAWEKMQRGVASFSIQLAKGRADIYPEMPVKVQGFKPEIDNAEWILTKVSHSLSDSGFTSALELEVKISDMEMTD